MMAVSKNVEKGFSLFLCLTEESSGTCEWKPKGGFQLILENLVVI